MNEHEQMSAWVRNCTQGVRALSSILCVPAFAIAITLAASAPAVGQRLVRTPIVVNEISLHRIPTRRLEGHPKTGLPLRRAITFKLERNRVSY